MLKVLFSSFLSGNSTALDPLIESFNKLVNSRFVERCPAHEPFLAPPSEEETPAKKRSAKSAKVVCCYFLGQMYELMFFVFLGCTGGTNVFFFWSSTHDLEILS